MPKMPYSPGYDLASEVIATGADVQRFKVTEAIAQHAGIDAGMASTVAATAIPYLVSFIKSKFSWSPC